jgi:signal transduction histidine kinase
LLVKTDMEQFLYLVTELLTNAATAMPQGGTVTVAVDAREAGYAEGEAPNGWVCLLVRDEGAGISPEVQARMYEPYFSTQGQERDKGLGLTLVYGIVRRAGGLIRCTSAPGEGATFEVLFPRRTGVEAAVV